MDYIETLLVFLIIKVRGKVQIDFTGPKTFSDGDFNGAMENF